MIYKLAKNDFKTNMHGSYLVLYGHLSSPLLRFLVYWFVFSVGLKAGTVSNYPFVLYLVSGIVPWIFLSGCAERWNQCLAGI